MMPLGRSTASTAEPLAFAVTHARATSPARSRARPAPNRASTISSRRKNGCRGRSAPAGRYRRPQPERHRHEAQSALREAPAHAATGAAEQVAATKPSPPLLPGPVTAPARARALRRDGGARSAFPNRCSPHPADTFHNGPALSGSEPANADAEDHKYLRGHAFVVSGPASATGAARLAAAGAFRVGAGAVTVASPPDALAVNAAHLTAIMLRSIDGPDGLERLLSDPRAKAVVVGPANGVGRRRGRMPRRRSEAPRASCSMRTR